MTIRDKIAKSLAASYFGFPKHMIEQCWTELADRKHAHKTWRRLAGVAIEVMEESK